ncbi:MAG TPA: PrsW family glutamic-type intramembrane protease [Casimicrobiaceae bacterium]|nr:PrsW family glutamic-type intramembrane protease [Casimicrobiaceae bacterium]
MDFSTAPLLSTSIIIASIVPLAFLFLIKWMNFLETHHLKFILLALLWGAISVELSYLVDHPLRLVLGKAFISVRTAPTVEEVFKSLILLYIVRRGGATSFVDGAIYGFASGIGFAVAENMLYLNKFDSETGAIVATVRAFTSSMHGSTTAIVGMAVAGFPLGRVRHPLIAWFIGLAAAISIHTIYNSTAFHNFAFGQTGLLVLAGISLAALVLVALTIVWGLRLERRRLRKSLGMQRGISKGEALLLQRVEDLDEVLAPIEERYGEVKREQVANALLLAAQLAMKQDQIRKTKDEELRAELVPQITELKRELKQARHDVGIYVMSQVRSIVPKTAWSLWARLGQRLTKLEPPRANLWDVLRGKLLGHNASGESIYGRVRVGLTARQGAAALAVEGEED